MAASSALVSVPPHPPTATCAPAPSFTPPPSNTRETPVGTAVVLFVTVPEKAPPKYKSTSDELVRLHEKNPMSEATATVGKPPLEFNRVPNVVALVKEQSASSDAV